jgi:hypothetical protein
MQSCVRLKVKSLLNIVVFICLLWTSQLLAGRLLTQPVNATHQGLVYRKTICGTAHAYKSL